MVAEVIEADDLEFARCAAKLRVAKALLDARLCARREGWSDAQLASRLRWSVGRWRSAFVDPLNLTLDVVSDILATCGRELSVEIVQCESLPVPPMTPQEPDTSTSLPVTDKPNAS